MATEEQYYSPFYPVLGICAGAVAVISIILGYFCCFVSIEPGYVGVNSWFGKTDEELMMPGPHLVHPFKKTRRVNCKTQKNEEPATVPTKNGLAVTMKATMQYRLSTAHAVKMINEVGDVYEEILIDPIFRNSVRDACAEFDAEALYTSDRNKVEAKVIEQLNKELSHRGIIIEGVQLLDPILPDVVKSRIEQKVAADQDVQRMQFVLKQRELEAQAKVVEANGIAKAQAIIKQDLTQEYLVYLWIEALKESAKHNNATIYIPTGESGLPFFKSPQPKGK